MSSELHLYLKYFHEGKGLDKTLDEVETENKQKEEGAVTSEHIDKIHIDLKEDGGIEKIIDISFTSKSYKSASRKKTKGKLYEKTIKIHQDKYSNSGNAWKVWDSGLMLARWLYANPTYIKDKIVHEIGSGCGLVGVLASYYCKSITLSDYKDEILENLNKNVKLNFPDDNSNISVKKLDFEQVYGDPSIIQEQVDIILASDIIYGVHLAAWVPKVVDRLLKPDGTFFCVNPKNRWGVDEFINNLESIGFKCSVKTFPEELCDDLVKKSNWDLFSCERIKKS